MSKQSRLVLSLICCLMIGAGTPLSAQGSEYVFELMERRDLRLEEIKQLADKHFERVGTGQGTAYKHFMRWHYEQQFHLNDKGFIRDPLEEEKALMDGLEALKTNAARGVSNTSAWVELGPSTVHVTSSWNPGNGRVRHVAVHPTNNLIMYAATDGGGIWKTTNGGNLWTPTTDGLPSTYQSMEQVWIDPANLNTVYAVRRNSSIVRSTDAGATWNTFYSTGPTTTRRMLLVPGVPGLILATTSSAIQRSTNGGTTWTTVLSSVDLEDIVLQPGSTTVMYAAGKGSQCFWRSTDAGLTWTNIGSSDGITHTGRSMIGVTPANPQIVYLLQASGSVFGRLYKSTDGGQTFITTIVGNSANGTNFFGYEPDGTDTKGQANHDMAIAVNPTNADMVHIAGIICFKSVNGGYSFTATTDWVYNNPIGYNHADVLWMGYVGGVLYSTSDGGVCKSLNDAEDWIPIWNTLACKQIYRACSAKSNPYTIGCGAQDNGHAYKLGSGPWNQWLGADGMDVAICPTNHLLAIAAVQNGGISRTTNGGTSYSGLTKPSDGAWVTPLLWHPTDSNTVYGAWTGVYKSNNKGGAWILLSGTTITSKVSTLAVAAADTNYIYASVGTTLYATTDGGTNWNTYAIGATISAIAVSPLNPAKVYITTSGTSSQVRVSTNAGASFTAISSGLPAIAARAIIIDENADETIYVGLTSGVYWRNNLSTGWATLGTGLPFAQVNDLDIQQSSRKLRVATYGRGMWEIDISEPVCGTPSNLQASAITNTGATLSWSAATNAVTYMVEYKMSTASTWTALSPTTATSVTVTGLSLGTNYQWRVKTICSPNTSFYGNGTFATLNQAILTLTQTYIEGYLNGSVMRPVLSNSGIAGSTTTMCDTITVALHATAAPNSGQFLSKAVLMTNGTATVLFPLGVIGNQYYIVVKGRNILETWSRNPVSFSLNTNYHFGSATQAYGNNLGNVNGLSVLYSGDISTPQDGHVDLLDYPNWESAFQTGGISYTAADLNGDGQVNILDYLIWENGYARHLSRNKP